MHSIFDDIWNKFQKEMEYLVRSKIANTDDAQDVLQDIFIKVYKNIDSVENVQNLKAWINKIASNTIIDHYKKSRLNTTDIDSMDIGDDEIIDESFNKEISKCLDGFLKQLAFEDESIIKKAHFEKLRHKQIASELNISETNSKVKLSRAKKRLKKLMYECCDFESDKYGNIVSYKKKKDCDC